jgi:hypothetical protein
MKPFTINSTTFFCKNGEILCSVKLYNRKIWILVFFLPLMLLCIHDLVVLPLVCLSMLDQFKLKDTYYMFSPCLDNELTLSTWKRAFPIFIFYFWLQELFSQALPINSFVLWFPFKCYLFQLCPHPPHASRHIYNPQTLIMKKVKKAKQCDRKLTHHKN